MNQDRKEYLKRYKSTPEYRAKKKTYDAQRWRLVTKPNPHRLGAHRRRNRSWWRRIRAK